MVANLVDVESQTSIIVSNGTGKSHEVLGNDCSSTRDGEIDASNVGLSSSFLAVMQSDDFSSKKISTWSQLRWDGKSHGTVVSIESMRRSPLDVLVVSGCCVRNDTCVEDLEPSQTARNGVIEFPSSHVHDERSSVR